MTQPEALRLADLIDWPSVNYGHDAAIELRRLYAENGALTAANERFGKRQEWWTERMFVLEQQRDALLEALKWIADVNATDYEYQAKARAAIAKAEGEKT